MDYVENQPNAAKLIESLRSVGYDNYSAICDLIDNSFDANADVVKVNIGPGVENDVVITISDNGEGMDRDTLDQAVRLGSVTNRDNSSLGKYGMGLVTASISIGKRVVVVTKNQGHYSTAIHDLDRIISANKFEKVLRDSNDEEKNMFLGKLGSSQNGTVVVIQKVDNLQNRNFSSFKSTLVRHCGEIFREFLNSNRKVVVNNTEVQPVDPLMLADSKTEIFLDEKREFQIGRETALARLRVAHLPKFNKQLADEYGINQSNQGFYVMRNGRQVARGESLKIFTKHNDFNRFRAELHFSGSLDKKMGINFKKEGINLTDDIRSWVNDQVSSQLKAIREIAKTEQSQKSKKADHTQSQMSISMKSATLKKPKLGQAKPSLRSLRTDDYTNVEFAVQNNSHLAPLFQYSVKGRVITINYNADHPFYSRVFSEIQDNPELVSAIDFVVYSSIIALIDITNDEKLWELQDRFLDIMSDNIRSLMS